MPLMSPPLEISCPASAQPTGISAAESVAQPMVTSIVPESGWQPVNVGELWRYRELLYFLVWRDVKIRYKQTVLGAAWAILQPAMLMFVFMFFSLQMGKASEGPVFFYLGVVP